MYSLSVNNYHGRNMAGIKKRRVLVVDEDQTNVLVLTRALRKEYETISAYSGQEALDKTWGEDPPHLILLDISMPDMDGYQVCEALKNDQRSQHIPVMFVSAFTSTEDEEKGLSLGAVDYVAKPFSISIMRARIANQFRILEAEEERVIKGKLQGALELAGTAAHEFSQPLQVLRNDLEYLKDSLPSEDQDVGEAWESVMQNTDRLAELIGKIQKITHYTVADYSDNMQIIDLDASVREE